MSKVNINGSGAARLVAILSVFLFAPLTLSAADSTANALAHSEHGAANNYHAGNVPVAIQHHDSPAETPLHCHLRSPLPQANGSSQAPNGSDQRLPALSLRFPSARENGMRLSTVSAQTPVAATSRFILFGSFRS